MDDKPGSTQDTQAINDTQSVDRKFLSDLRDRVIQQIFDSYQMQEIFWTTFDCYEATSDEYQDMCEKTKSPLELVFVSAFRGAQKIGIIDREIKMTNQVKCAGYFIDFVLEHKGKKLAIELDGYTYHDRNKYEFDRSRKRQNEIVKNGYTVFVYTYQMMRKDFEQIIEDINRWTYEVTPV